MIDVAMEDVVRSAFSAVGYTCFSNCALSSEYFSQQMMFCVNLINPHLLQAAILTAVCPCCYPIQKTMMSQGYVSHLAMSC